MQLIYTEGERAGQPVRVGDRIPGGRVDKYCAHIEKIDSEAVSICYNGEVRTVRILTPQVPRVIGAEWK